MWTKEQNEAINKEGTNIIVSAGAGSGKTAVLSERVIRKLKDGININNILILTFTNKAAKEMKDRIRNKIIKETLSEQLELLNVSYITTFDSYASSIVKKYYYLVDIDKDFNIEIGNILEIEKINILNEIFDEYYKEGSNLFINFIKDFCLKNDLQIKKQIIEVSKKLDLKYDKIEYLNNYIKKHFTKEFLDIAVNDYEKIIKEKLLELVDITNQLTHLYDLNETYNYLKELIDKDYSYIKKNFVIEKKDYKLKENKIEKEKVNKLIDEIKNLLIYSDIDEMKQEIIFTKDYTQLVIDIIIKLYSKLDLFKKETNMYSFNDIALKAIDVVKNNKLIAESIKCEFNEIMIDEYQDTSDIQEIFISYIENNNLYMVGDIKQSIYSFRNANPLIFKNKYDLYKKNINGYKIDLTKNFRSNKGSIDAVNSIFNEVMSDNVGGAAYKKEHQMHFGNENYSINNINNNIQVYSYDYDKTFTKEETEVYIIAEDIKAKVGKELVLDKENNVLRFMEYKDISVLISKAKHFNLYKKVFEYLKIPVIIHQDENITNNINIKLIKNILEYIVSYNSNFRNKAYYYNLLSIGRSYLFEYTDDYLFTLISKKNDDEGLVSKIKDIDILNSSISDVLDAIINNFDIYNKLILIGNVKENISVIDYLLEVGKSYENMGKNTNDFIKYLNDLLENKLNIKLEISSAFGNGVNIMTIHKSKGLEFHLCYYPEVYDKFYIPELKDKLLYGNQMILPYFNGFYKNTILKTIYSNNYSKYIISEKVRLFYVALTRAREQIIILNNFDNEYKKDKFSSFKDIIDSVKKKLEKNTTIIKSNVDRKYLLNNVSYTINKCKTKLNVIENKEDLEVIIKSKFSKNETFGKTSDKNLGTKLHYILEMIDFSNPNLENINIDNIYIKKIQAFFDCELFNSKIINIYKEYEFINIKDNEIQKGIIDLLLEYNDKFVIVDYKLKNIDDKSYIKQLKGYKRYLEKITNKKIEIFLYSILNEKLMKL